MPADWEKMSDFHPERVKHAVTWRIVSELMRRHHEREGIGVFELHPAGGQGDTLSLRKVGPRGQIGGQLNDFRGWRRLGSLEPKEPVEPLEPEGGYVQPFLESGDALDVVAAVERHCALPAFRGQLKPSSAPVLAYRVMAEVLTLQLTGRYAMNWRSAAIDSSGMAGSSIDKRFTALPHFAKAVEGDDGLGKAYDFWMLVPIGPRSQSKEARIRMVVHLSGQAWTGPKLDTAVSLTALRKLHKTLPAMALALLEDRA